MRLKLRPFNATVEPVAMLIVRDTALVDATCRYVAVVDDELAVFIAGTSAVETDGAIPDGRVKTVVFAVMLPPLVFSTVPRNQTRSPSTLALGV